MNQQAFSELLQGLHIVGNIRPNHQMYTQSQALHVEPKERWPWSMRRWWSGEDRHVNLQRVEHLTHAALTELDMLLTQHATYGSSDKKQSAVIDGIEACTASVERHLKHSAINTRLTLLVEALQNLRQGLSVIRTTYRTDGRVEARVEVLDKFVDSKLKEVQRVLNNNAAD